MDIVPMHLRKMPLTYRGMAPSQSGPLWLQSGGHHGLGQYLRNGGNKILPRNLIISTEEFEVRGSTINLILFYFNHEDELPPHAASTHGAALLHHHHLWADCCVLGYCCPSPWPSWNPLSDLHGKCKPSSFPQS
jgi:hypothetical protein